nr:M56 family metallopeptidase [Vallitalea pronyensis]
MLKDTIYFVFNMSIVGSAMIVLLMVIRYCMKSRIPKTFIYPLWAIVLFRLLIPISISSKWSLMNGLNPSKVKSIGLLKGEMVTLTDRSIPQLSYTNSIQSAKQYFPIEHKSDIAESFFETAGYVWLLGAIICLLCVLIVYGVTLYRTRTGIRHQAYEKRCRKCMGQLQMKGYIPVIEVDFIKTPVAIGFLKPRIIIPRGISKDEIDYILLHELSHIRRRDPLWKLLSIVSVCVHWFNPLVWLFLYTFDLDMEMACDEKVLHLLPKERFKMYATTLAVCARKQQVAFTAFGSTAVKERVVNITKYKRLPLLMAVVMTVFCLVLSILLVTNPM